MRKYRQLTEEDRIEIYAMKQAGKEQNKIAVKLGVHSSTISRELARDMRGSIANRVGIEKRPKIVERKIRIGDWEGNTVVGKNHQGALVTLVDRKSKLTLIRQYVPKGSDVRSLTDHEVQHIMDRLNNRPGKSLGFLTPNEVFYERKKLTG